LARPAYTANSGRGEFYRVAGCNELRKAKVRGEFAISEIEKNFDSAGFRCERFKKSEALGPAFRR
jgi:hypothetical protein